MRQHRGPAFRRSEPIFGIGANSRGRALLTAQLCRHGSRFPPRSYRRHRRLRRTGWRRRCRPARRGGPNGSIAIRRAARSGSANAAAASGVAISPGSIELARTPLPSAAHSSAVALVNIRTAALCRAISGDVDAADDATDRRDVDDRAASGPRQQRQEFARGKEGGIEIDRDRRAPCSNDVSAMARTGAAPALLTRMSSDPHASAILPASASHAPFVGNVHRYGEVAFNDQPGGSRFDGRSVTVDQCDTRSFAGQAAGGFEADSRGRTGDDRAAAGEAGHESTSSPASFRLISTMLSKLGFCRARIASGTRRDCGIECGGGENVKLIVDDALECHVGGLLGSNRVSIEIVSHCLQVRGFTLLECRCRRTRPGAGARPRRSSS